MDQKQSFNLNTDFLVSFTSVFMKFVFVIIFVYVIVLILNFLRDKFVNKVTNARKDDISELLIILNKIFFISGFGFIIGNIVQFIFCKMTHYNSVFNPINFKGDWDYLTYGVILIFIGIGLKAANKVLKNDKIE